MSNEPERVAALSAVTQGTVRGGQLQKGDNGLTVPQTVSALLEAQGWGLADIERFVGTQRSQIHSWRRENAYQEQIEIFRAENVSLLQGELGGLRAEMIEGAKEAVAQLREALKAETDTGGPRWNVRLQAAATLLAQAVALSRIEGANWKDSGTNEPPKTAVIVVQGDGTVHSPDKPGLLGAG